MKIKTIDINALEWFDKVNGNSYFAGTVTLNYGLKDERQIVMPFQYGYGKQYEQEATGVLIRQNLIPADITSLWRYCQDNKIILRSQITDKCLKRELTATN